MIVYISFWFTTRKNAGGPFGEIFFSKNKSRSAEKNERGPFGLARYGILRGKTGKKFFGSDR